MRTDALFLFDIDGTLMRGGNAVHRDAFAHAFRTVYGVALSLDGIDAGGRTDSWLLAEPLRRHGLPDVEIAAGQSAAFAAMTAYVEEHTGDLRGFVLPGVRETLESLRSEDRLLGLLTGNLSRIAWRKLAAAGLDSYFRLGGFGEESEVRAHLVPVALAHAHRLTGTPIPVDRVVVIGDTPLDVEAGQAHGTRTVAVATGHVPEDVLRASGTDLVLPSFAAASACAASIAALVDAGGEGERA